MKIKCLSCNGIIESKHRHNLVNCKCGNCYIDGGQDYLHFGGNDFNKVIIIFDDGTEVLASDEEKFKKKYERWKENRYKFFIEYKYLNEITEEKQNMNVNILQDYFAFLIIKDKFLQIFHKLNVN